MKNTRSLQAYSGHEAAFITNSGPGGCLIFLAMVALAFFTTGAQAETTVYVSEHYEVRDHDEPVKYVFQGESRVARITGSLTANTRIQRLRLSQGWNLCSVAVGGMPLPRRPAGQSADLVTAAHRWNPTTRTWASVPPNESLVAGTVLWLRANTNTVLAISGFCPDPTNQVVAVGGSFHGSAGMTSTPLRADGGATEGSPARAGFDSTSQTWRLQQPAIPMTDAEFPDFIAPGQAVFIHTDAPVELEPPDPAGRVRYYHQDHLGSSSVVTDADGQSIAETAFYPFGEARHELQEVEESYQFAQKERDRESGLDYLEARYLSAGLSRFATVDPKYLSPDGLSPSDLGSVLGRPQELNLYAYAYNNPIRYHDPTGLDGKDAFAWGNDAAGLGAGAADEAALWQSKKTPLFPLMSSRTANVVGVVGKVTTVISVGMKAKEFYDKPSEATGAQFANEGAKALLGIVAAPVGLVWSFADLTGYGPSQIIQSTHNTIEAHKGATAAWNRTEAAAKGMTKMINQRAPGVAAKFDEAEKSLKVFHKTLKAGTPKLAPNDPSLEQLNAKVARAEANYRSMQRQLFRERARARKAMAQ